MNTYYHDKSAYSHSFSPADSAGYVLSQVQSGDSLDAAVRQASIEHGPAQAREVEALLADEMEGRDYRNRRSLIPALRRVVARAQRAARQVSEERQRENECRSCGNPLSHEIGEWEESGQTDRGARPTICDECKVWNFECDNGHKWQATEAQDIANDGKCPKCGEPWS